MNARAAQFERMTTVVIRLGYAMPAPYRMKNNHLQREDWRRQGKRRGRATR